MGRNETSACWCGSPVTPELLLLHTLSHLLMRALILDCGYSSAALR